MSSYYSFLHKSVKWWRKVFFWLLEVAVINGYIIYKHHTHRQALTHLEFRRSVLHSLVQPLVAIPRAQRGRHPHQSLERLSMSPRHFCERGKRRRDCRVCSDRTAGKRVVTPYFCTTCSDRPFLCLGECFVHITQKPDTVSNHQTLLDHMHSSSCRHIPHDIHLSNTYM